MPILYHLVEPKYWEKFLNSDFYTPPTYAQEGFIHLSLREQLDGTLARHYPEAKELVVLLISERVVMDHLKYEPGGPNGELFPHYYGELPIEAVTDTNILFRTKKGDWEWV
ncbi:MAG: DUF952 domain-containing protein [Bacteroidia bacterium]|nr:DUF952 domain-containing protein [Bacteroidia bacterium]